LFWQQYQVCLKRDGIFLFALSIPKQYQTETDMLTLGANDVKTFLKHPDVPRAVLEDIYQMLRIMLNKQAEQVDSDQEVPGTIVSAREQMYYEENPDVPTGFAASGLPDFTTGSSAAVARSSQPAALIKSSLKAQAEAPIRGGDIDPQPAIVKASYITADKYGDGYIELSDKSYDTLINATHKSCVQQNLYFPYGFGSGKNQLKIKKLNLGTTRKEITISLKFSRWEMNGKTGFSCCGEVVK
jgi:hypothetical protein